MHPQMQELQHMALLSSHSRLSLSLCQSNLLFSLTFSLVCLFFLNFLPVSLLLVGLYPALQVLYKRALQRRHLAILHTVNCRDCVLNLYLIDSVLMMSPFVPHRRIMGGKVQLFLLICWVTATQQIFVSVCESLSVCVFATMLSVCSTWNGYHVICCSNAKVKPLFSEVNILVNMCCFRPAFCLSVCLYASLRSACLYVCLPGESYRGKLECYLSAEARSESRLNQHPEPIENLLTLSSLTL